MSPQIIFLLAMAAYVVALVFVGIKTSRNQTDAGFVIGSRSVGMIPTMGSLAASFRDGMGAVFWTGIAYSYGYGGLWLIYGAMLGLVFLSIVAPKVRDYAEEQGFVTVGDFLKNKLGGACEKTVSLFILLKAFLFIGIQLYVVGLICSNVFGVPDYVGIFGTALVIFMYLYFGGYSSVVKTDSLQFFMIMGLIIVPFFIQPDWSQALDFSTYNAMGWQSSLGLFIIGVFYVIAGADVWQRIFSARDAKVIRWAFPLSGVFLLVMTLTLIAIGYGLMNVLPTDLAPDEVLFALFSNLDAANPYVIAFMGVTIMAVSMSTLDTEAYVFTSSFVRNFLPTQYSEDRKSYIKISRTLISFLLLGTAIVSLAITDVIKFLFDAVSLVYVIVPLLVASIFGWAKPIPRQDIFLTASILVAASVYMYLFLTGGFVNLLYNCIPLGVSVVLCGISILFTRERKAS